MRHVAAVLSLGLSLVAGCGSGQSSTAAGFTPLDPVGGNGGSGGSTGGSAGSKGGADGSTAGGGAGGAPSGGHAGVSIGGSAGQGAGGSVGGASSGGSPGGGAGGIDGGAAGGAADGCVIDGQDVAPGAVDPGNACRACAPAQSTSDWSTLPDGTTCDAGVSCFRGVCPTVFTIVLENASYSDVVGTGKAPYLDSLIASYGLATNYRDSGVHPSLPNYLTMVSGATHYLGGIDLLPTILPFPVNADNLGHQLTAAGIGWRAYLESMGKGKTCLLSDAPPYAPRHNPFVYFQDFQDDPTYCQKVDVDYSLFDADLASGAYHYMWITPDLIDDGHDTDVMTADAWCSHEIPKILASDAFHRGGILFITWDEGSGTILTGDQVPMIVVSSLVPAGTTSAQPRDHASFLATVEDIFHLPRLGAAAKATPLMEFFP